MFLITFGKWQLNNYWDDCHLELIPRPSSDTEILNPRSRTAPGRGLAVGAGLARGSSPTRATAEGRLWTAPDAAGEPPSPPGGAQCGGGGVKSRTLTVAPQPHAVWQWAPGSAPASPETRALLSA